MENINATAYTLGYTDEEGAFKVFATLNNHMMISHESMSSVVEVLQCTLQALSGEEMYALERQDAPDYLDLIIEE